MKENRKVMLVKFITGASVIFIFSEDGKEVEYAKEYAYKECRQAVEAFERIRNNSCLIDIDIDEERWKEHKTVSKTDKIFSEWCLPYYENIDWVLLADSDRDYVPKEEWF